MNTHTHDRPVRRRIGLRLWHWAVIVLFVAVAIANIQDQRITNPRLLALAIVGFGGYAILAVLGWKLCRRLEPRLGFLAVLILYLTALGVLFVVASFVYVAISDLYQFGTL